MEPISPVLTALYVDQEIIFAKDQPEYRQLPALLVDDGRTVLTRWKLSDEERKAVASGADLTIAVMTFGQRLQPILPEVFGLDSFSKQVDIDGQTL